MPEAKPREKPEELRQPAIVQAAKTATALPTAAGSRARASARPVRRPPGRSASATPSANSRPATRHFRTAGRAGRRSGVYEAGGFPLEFPVMSLGETQLRPTAMLYRNLASMDVEESIRGNPIDGVVLLMGCDKTTPSPADGRGQRATCPPSASAAGPCSTASGAGQELGSGTGRAGAWSSRCARAHSSCRTSKPRAACTRSHGHCMTMGTASTMASMVESAGRGPARQRRLPGRGRPPQCAGSQCRPAHRRDGACRTRRISQHADARGLRERHPHAAAAIGGSTNAVIHLIAIAGRMGVKLTVDDFDRLGTRAALPAQPAALAAST